MCEVAKDELARLSLAGAALAIDHHRLRATSRVQMAVGAGCNLKDVRLDGCTLTGCSIGLEDRAGIQGRQWSEGIQRDQHRPGPGVDLAFSQVPSGYHMEERRLVQMAQEAEVVHAILHGWISRLQSCATRACFQCRYWVPCAAGQSGTPLMGTWIWEPSTCTIAPSPCTVLSGWTRMNGTVANDEACCDGSRSMTSHARSSIMR